MSLFIIDMLYSDYTLTALGCMQEKKNSSHSIAWRNIGKLEYLPKEYFREQGDKEGKIRKNGFVSIILINNVVLSGKLTEKKTLINESDCGLRQRRRSVSG